MTLYGEFLASCDSCTFGEWLDKREHKRIIEAQEIVQTVDEELQKKPEPVEDKSE